MTLWQNPNNDLGQPLSRQQQLMLEQGAEKIACYWFEFDLVTVNSASIFIKKLEGNIVKLMQIHQSLTTFYGIPENFDVMRQQVQAPRLSYQHFIEKNMSAEIKQTFEQQAIAHFEQKQPHLLAWCWQQTEKITVLLTAPTLMLDNYSAYALFKALQTPHRQHDNEVMQYPEYIDWLNELLNDEDAQAGKSYWHSLALNTVAEARLSEQKITSRDVAKKIQAVSVILPQSIQQQLTNIVEQLGTNVSTVAVNVWAVILSKLSNCDELKLDYYHDCRHDYEEFSTGLGLYTQPLPIPFYQIKQADLSGACQGFAQLFEEIKDNQEYIASIEHLANTFCHAGFYWHQQTTAHDMSCKQSMTGNALCLVYLATEQGNGKITLYFDENRYNKAAMQRTLAHFNQLLEQAIQKPDEKMYQLNGLLPDERSARFIAQNNALSLKIKTTPSKTTINTKNIISLFKQQAKKWPEKMALKAHDNKLTYKQLDELSDKYAAAFQSMGAKPDAIIALCLPRTSEFLISLLAVLKSGAAYLPLDPEQPIARLQHIIDDADPIILVSELTELASNQCCSLSQLAQSKMVFQPAKIQPKHLAYVLYTSGSTGQPKGVQVEHQQISHYSVSVIEQLQLPSHAHYGLISSLMADLGNTMLFPAWLTGSCLHLLDKNEVNDGKVLAKYMQKQPLDCLKIVPSHLEALLASGENILPKAVLVLGGEPIQASLMEQLKGLQPHCRLYNHYGPTETTVGVLIGEINVNTKQTQLTASIGHNDIHLLDDDLQPVISGQCAELYVAGPSVTRGYLNDVEQTDAVYLPNSLPIPLGNPNKTIKNKLYRTGDLAISHADGSISIVGRLDQQIKIRGFRLDLNEIQQLLLSLENITQATLQTTGEGANTQLLAFVIMANNQSLDEIRLLDYLRKHLPNYMIPTHVYALLQFPLNNNGKIDKKHLIELSISQQQQVLVAPKNTLEQAILTIWQDVLQQRKICITANFFDIGGHSLAAIKIVAKIRKHLEVNLPTDLLFNHKTIADIVYYIDRLMSPSLSINPRLLPLNKMAKKDGYHQKEPTLVLMHSLAGHFNYHQGFINHLAETFPLFGLTPNVELLSRSEQHLINTVTDDYIEQLLPLKNNTLILVGWSLGSKQMMLMAERMVAIGFTVKAISIIDFDPAQKLKLTNNSAQLINDFNDYLIAENITIQPKIINEITQSLDGDYLLAMQQLLNAPQIQTLLGEDISKDELRQRFIMRFKIKHLLYNSTMPSIDLPLWLWHGTGHQSSPKIWQQFSSLPLQSSYIDSDHYDILNRSELMDQLLNNIKQLTPMAIF